MPTYYPTWQEAESYRQKEEKIYYEPDYGYYIVRPKKRIFKRNLMSNFERLHRAIAGG